MSKNSTAKTSEASTAIFNKIAALVQKITGVQLGERQKAMVETRLAKRQIELGLADEFEYFEYFEKNLKEETAALVSIMTTHHTYFFREYSHFEYLEKHAIKEAVEAAKARGDNKIRIWSAACSRGQEVYSLAMFLEFHLKKIAPSFGYEITGSDVDPESVSIAQNGVYARKEIKEVPLTFLADHWAKGTGDIADYVKVKTSLKQSCKFKTVNLINLGAEPVTEKYDIIFCRNVFIYFTVEQIKLITSELLRRMHSTGVLFIGISESLHGIGLPVRAEGASIYRHADDQKEPSKIIPLTTSTKNQAKTVAPLAAKASTATSPSAEAPQILRVLCIDDSPSILVVLKQVLKKKHGFDVVATAANGIEATQKLKELGNKIDLVTLDIHMPHQDGMDYLQKNMSAKHPPVVMISSVSRENSNLALRCLELGAKDYVEKPALSNLNERGEEIRLKLHCAFQSGRASVASSIQLDKGFAKPFTIKDPEKKFRLVIAGLADRKKLCQVLKELTQAQPPTLILVQGADGALPALAADIAKVEKINVTHIETIDKLQSGKIYLGDFKKLFSQASVKYNKTPTSVIVFGLLGKETATSLKQLSNANILLEDIGIQLKDNSSVSVASDIVPATSFAYMSSEFLSK